jgi:ferritin-like metal-binding protein YciE
MDAIKKKKNNALNTIIKSKSQDEVYDGKNSNSHMTPQEIEILNTKEDALIKNAEIMAYKKVLKVAEKITDKDAIDILKQNLQEKESTYANITTSEIKNRRFATHVKATLAEEKRHLQLCTRLAKEIAAASSA